MVNGHGQNEQTEMIQGDGFGVGGTIDDDGDAVVLAWVMYDGQAIGVSFDPELARRMAASVMNMADEVEKMGESLHGMTDDEVATEIRKIADRMNDEG